MITALFRRQQPQGPAALFASEALIRANHDAFTEHTRGLLNGLPLLLLAYDLHLEKTKDKYRKDGVTPAKIHEQRHMHVADKVLEFSKLITPEIAKKFGSREAFITAAILHDMREDRGMTESDLRRYLEDNTERLYREGKIDVKTHDRMYDDIRQAMIIVDCLTRNEGDKIRHGGNRDKQMEQLLKHPYAFLIKQIDWCDKLATMVGVFHFEENNQDGIIKVLKETARYFQDTNQNYARRAEQLYPFAKKPIYAMDCVMGVQYNMLLHDVHSFPGNEDFKEKHKPVPFAKFYPEAPRVLRGLHRGVHYIHNMIDRMNAVENPVLQCATKKEIMPQLLPFTVEGNTLTEQLKESFSAAASRFIKTGWISRFQNTMP